MKMLASIAPAIAITMDFKQRKNCTFSEHCYDKTDDCYTKTNYEDILQTRKTKINLLLINY